jgi:hypothetical protein
MNRPMTPDPARARRAAMRLVRLGVTRDPTTGTEAIERLLDHVDEDVVLDLAAHHRIEGLLYERLRTVPAAPAGLVAALKAQRDSAAQRHLYGLWQLGRVQAALDDAGVPWVVVKGPVLVELLYGAAGRRTYHDLDVLVRPSDFRTAVERLQAIGGRLLDRNWPLLHRERRGQVHVELHPGMSLDLHWDLVNVHRRRMSIDTGALLDRRVRLDVGGVSAPTLDTADSVIHLAVHAALSGGDLLVWLKDVERAVAVRPPSWDEVVARSAAWRVSGPVAVILERARTIVGADVPESVPARLIGRRRLELIRRIDRRWMLDAPPGGPTPARFMARLIGHGPTGGLLVLWHRVFRHFDPREPHRSSPFAPAGSPHDRDAYFEAVETGAR